MAKKKAAAASPYGGPWTRFMDMSSGGGRKEDFAKLYIEAPEVEAKVIFFNRFGHNPERVTCTCCGDDYSIDDYPTLERATAYDRGCAFDRDANDYVERPKDDPRFPTLNGTYIKLPDFIAGGRDVNGWRSSPEKVAFIFAKDIKPEERAGCVPSQGYVWVS